MNKDRWNHRFELKPNCWVFVPTKASLIRGKEIKSEIELKWRTPYYYAHLKAGGHVTALKTHINNKYLIRTDIQNYFNSINLTRITRELKPLFKPYNHAREIALESVVKNPNSSTNESILPFGFVQSPIIASLCLYKSALGRYLHKLENKGFKVSVYMDDIIISTSEPYNTAETALIGLHEKARQSNFILNPDKTFGPVEQITAFNINLSKGSIEITEERLKEFKKEYQESNSEYVRNGIHSYINSVSLDQGKSLLT